MTDANSWDEAIKHAESAFGPINVLVNNAGIDIMKPFIEFTGADLQKLLNVNLFGNFYGMQKVLPSMKKAGGGSIVNISSVEGLRARLVILSIMLLNLRRPA